VIVYTRTATDTKSRLLVKAFTASV